MDESGAEIREGRELVADIADDPREPREHCGLGSPGDRERRAGEQVGERDCGERERDRCGERAEIAVPPSGEEGRGDQPVHGSRGEHRPALVAAVELGDRRDAGEDAAQHEQRRGEGAERGRSQPVLPADRRPEVEEPEERGCRDDVPFGRVGLGEQDRDLRQAGRDADAEQARPSLPDGDDRRACEDERGEPGSRGAQLAALEPDGSRRKGGADEPEARDELGRPGERRRDAGGRDPGRDEHRRPVGNEVVQDLGGEQRHVARRRCRRPRPRAPSGTCSS